MHGHGVHVLAGGASQSTAAESPASPAILQNRSSALIRMPILPRLCTKYCKGLDLRWLEHGRMPPANVAHPKAISVLPLLLPLPFPSVVPDQCN
jgi:hypothetical protein